MQMCMCMQVSAAKTLGETEQQLGDALQEKERLRVQLQELEREFVQRAKEVDVTLANVR